MSEEIQKNIDFVSIYNKSHRLASAVFVVSNTISQDEGLKTKVKNLSLKLVSASINLKDINFLSAPELIVHLEKNSLELMSILDIASTAGLISKMNGSVLKEEFQSLVLELGRLSNVLKNSKNASVKNIFSQFPVAGIEPDSLGRINSINRERALVNNNKVGIRNESKNYNGHRRKDFRRNTILGFIKRHDNVSIKDIVPNINGCSEKTIQRELISLIKEGKVKKIGERRWSKYSIV